MEKKSEEPSSASETATAGVASITASSTDEKDEERTEPIWVKQDWELTWPIWHLLPHSERKTLAKQHGYATIGEFEEFMILSRAVGETDDGNSGTKPYANESIYGYSRPSSGDKQQPKEASGRVIDGNDGHRKMTARQSDGNDEDDNDDDEEGEPEQHELAVGDAMTEDEANLGVEDLIECGGLILSLPEELLHNIFAWLSVDTYARLALVSPHWRYLTRTEAVYKRLCERLYLNQSKRRALHVGRFGGSYRNMLLQRPRVRTGLYVMKFAKVKPIQRDMWTEIPIGAILETVYYRYLYFQENGTLLYALTTAAPHEMIPRLLRTLITNEPDRAAVWGTFVVQGKSVTVVAKQEWHTVKFHLSIIPQSPHWGRFGALTIDRHLSSASADFDEYFSRDLVEYKVPSEVFRYLRDRRLN